jgi:hypothetical protein|tara:strand:- start:145 stop:546 length:402 start_codon:yes stop_codon:yes gene_type:complete
MKIRNIIFYFLLFPKFGLAESTNYLLFKDLVQYTSSVDAYSNICVKNFNHKQAETDLFDLILILKINYRLEENDIMALRDKYHRINKSTTSQLTQLGLNKRKNLCTKYLKIFERFDKKKNEKLTEILAPADIQ